MNVEKLFKRRWDSKTLLLGCYENQATLLVLLLQLLLQERDGDTAAETAARAARELSCWHSPCVSSPYSQ